MTKKAFLLLLSVLCSFSSSPAQQAANNLGQLQQLKQVALEHYHQADFDSSITYWQLALNEARNIENVEWQSRFLASIAVCHKKLGRYETAILYNDSAIAEAQAIDYKAVLARCYNNKGTLFLEMGLLSSAHESFLQAKTLKEQLNDTCSLGSTLLNLGEVELRLKDYAEANTFYTQSLAIRRLCQDTFGTISCLINLNIVARHKKDTTTCRVFLDEASLLIQTNPEKYVELQIIAYENEALLLLNQRQFDRAIDLYNSAYKLALKKNWLYDQSHCLNQIGIAKYGQKQLEKAEEFSIKAHQIAEEANMLEKQMESAENLVDVYQAWRKPEKAAHWLSEYKSLRDSLLNTTVLENIFDHGAEQELEAWRLKTDSAQTKLIEVQAQLEDTDTHKTFYMMSVGFLLLIFGGGFVSVRYSNKRKKMELVRAKKEKGEAILATASLKENLQKEKDKKIVPIHHQIAENPGELLSHFPPKNNMGITPFTDGELELIGNWFKHPNLSETALAQQIYKKETRETLKWFSKCIREKLTAIDGAELKKNGKTKLYSREKAKDRLMDMVYETLKENV